MKIHYKYYFSFLLCVFCFVLHAQDETSPAPAAAQEEDAPPAPKRYYLLSPRVSITVPHPMANKSFKKSFVGIYEISAGLNLMVKKGFFIGAMYKNGLLKITENKIADYNADMNINNVAVKIGGDMYVGDRNRIIFSSALSIGRNWTNYYGLVCKTPNERPRITSYTDTFVEPEINLFFLIESNFGIGATVSYTFYNKNFDPYELCLNEWRQYPKINTGVTQYLSFGFGFYYSLIPKKKR